MKIFNPGNGTETQVRDPSRLSATDANQLAYFAAVNGITERQARELVQAHGDNLAVLVKEARKLREFH
jgi:hypothetical protein